MLFFQRAVKSVVFISIGHCTRAPGLLRTDTKLTRAEGEQSEREAPVEASAGHKARVSQPGGRQLYPAQRRRLVGEDKAQLAPQVGVECIEKTQKERECRNTEGNLMAGRAVSALFAWSLNSASKGFPRRDRLAPMEAGTNAF